MDSLLHRRLLLCLFLSTAMVAYLQSTAVIANERTPVYRHFSLKNRGNKGNVVSIAETSDGVLFIGCREKFQVVVFDGNNWEEIALPSAPRSIVTDQHDRVWVSMDDGLGFIQRDRLGACHFERFDLQQQESDSIKFPVAFKTAKGVRFGNSRIIADIDCSTNEPTTKLYRAQGGERFIAKDGNGIYSFFEDKNKLFQLKDGERVTVETEFFPGGVFGCRLSKDSYLFANSKYSKFHVKRGGKWQVFSEDLQSRFEGVSGRWFRPLSEDRIVFATPKAFLCYDPQGKLLWLVNESVRRFGELSNGRIWLSGDSGFYIVERDDSASSYSFEPHTFKRVTCIDVTKKGVFLSGNSGLFRADLEKKKGDFPKLKGVEKLTPNPTRMTWHSKDAHFATSFSGMVDLKDPTKTSFDLPILYGFTSSNQHFILSRSGGRVSVLDADLKRVVELVFPFDALHIIEVSPTKFWVLGKAGRFVVADFEPDFKTCKVKTVEGLAITATVRRIDGHLCVVNRDGLFSPELKPHPDGRRLSLELKEADKRFSKLKAQTQKREILNAVDCADFGLLLCGSNHFSMHKLVDGQYESKPFSQWTILGEIGNQIAWDPYRSVVWATLNDGLVALLPQSGETFKPFKPVLEMFVSPKEAVYPFGSDEPFKIDDASDISFRYGVPNAPDATPFQFLLEGLDKDWSKWTRSTVRNYDRLPSGEYQFHVRANRANGETVSASSKRFLVKKPWYATYPAIALFSLLAIGFIFGASSIRAKQLAVRNKEMERLIAIRTEEIQKQKKEIEEKSDLLVQQCRNAESEKLKSFDTLVAGISHDFNNLLAVISTNSELFALNFGPQAEQMSENMQAAIRSAAELCGELSAITDVRKLNVANDSLRNVVKEVLPILQSTVPPGVSLDVNFCDEPTGVSIDLTEIKRAVLNLVVNAAEFAKHQIAIGTSVTSFNQEQLKKARFVGVCPPPGRFACLAICDDGPGIKQDYLGRLFDPFFTTNDLGRGLGLAIVMRVIARHNGVVLVEKSKLGGACFRLCLPLVDQIESAKSDPTTCVNDKKFKVLLVDDNQMVLQSTSIVVETLGHEVLSTNSAAKGLEILRQIKDVDVIILDISMPEMSGVEMAKILLKDRPGFPIIFVSGFNNEKIENDLLQLPNISFLNKPYRISTLDERISQACVTHGVGESELAHSSHQHATVRGK